MKTFYIIAKGDLTTRIDGRLVLQIIIDVQFANSHTAALLHYRKSKGRQHPGITTSANNPQRYHTQYEVVDRAGQATSEGGLSPEGCPYFVVSKSKPKNPQEDWVQKLADSGKLLAQPKRGRRWKI